jgi:hypothetical protein
MNKLITISLFLFSPYLSRAQINTRWFLDVSKDITKSISLGAQLQVREQGFQPKLDRYMGVGSLNIDLTKRISVSGKYRILRPIDQTKWTIHLATDTMWTSCMVLNLKKVLS